MFDVGMGIPPAPRHESTASNHDHWLTVRQVATISALMMAATLAALLLA